MHPNGMAEGMHGHRSAVCHMWLCRSHSCPSLHSTAILCNQTHCIYMHITGQRMQGRTPAAAVKEVQPRTRTQGVAGRCAGVIAAGKELSTGTATAKRCC